MRLRTENIHEYRLKCNTVAQITLDDDFNVPDTKDDIELIKSAYMSEEKCDLSKMPSMTGYIADGTKTLWDVSKMYHTTADSIKASNPKCADGLSESVIIPRGTKLLLVKA